MMRLLCIDRFESNWAVCEQEDGSMIQLSRELLPINAQEGDFLRETASGYQLDAEAKAVALQRNAEKLNKLFAASQNK